MVRVRPGHGTPPPDTTSTTATAASSTPAAISARGTDPRNSTGASSATTDPTTRAADRTRLSSPGASTGSGMVGVLRGLDPALLAPYRARIKNALEAVALAAPSPQLTAALTALSTHPQAEQLAVMALTGRRSSQVDASAIAGFGTLKVSREAAVASLVDWHRAEAITDALAGHHGDVARFLRPALESEPDLARWQKALAVVTTLAETNAGSYRLASVLTTAGALTPGEWPLRELIPGQDAIGALLTIDLVDDRGFDDPVAGAKADQAMTARGVFASEKYARSKDLGTHRGILGEALRIADVEATLTSPAQHVVQGILVLHAPDALWNAPDGKVAQALATELGIPLNELHHHRDQHGVSHWARLLTELDVAVFETQPDGRERPLRFENVKAGQGSTGKAREQNARAADHWDDPQMRYLFPDGKKYVTPSLDRSAEAREGIVTATVGPSDDPRYDVALPLSTHDITALALRHP